jgi:signal transduction histidine kinase
MAVASTGTTQNISINDSVATITGNANPDHSIKQINLSAFHFVKAQDNRINFGIVGSEYNYIVLKLNSANTYAEQYLSIDNTSLDTVSIYRIHNDGSSRLLYQGGDLVAFNSKRNYVWHTIPVEINKNPSFYLIALKASEKNINVKYEILGKDDLQKKYQDHDRVVFFYIGIVCLITAIIVLAFFLFKKAVFAAYLGYIICISVWIVSHYGYIFPFVYPHSPVINEIVKPVSSLGASFFLIIVLNLVFSQHLQSRRWLQQCIKWMLYILSMLTGFMLLLLIPDVGTQVKAVLIAAWHIGLILSICIIVFTPLCFIHSGSTAKIFSIAMLVICIMSIIQLIANSGYINNFIIDEHGMTMGILLENSIMAFGLFFSLLEEKKQKEIQVLALEQEQTETLKKLINVQDNERKRIAGDLHDNIGPLLAALKINFRRIIYTKAEDLQNGLVGKTESIIDDSIAEIRNVAHNLMPKGLSSNGLINTLTEYFGCIEQLYNKTIVFHHQIQSIFNPDLQINIYRIICELVLNAARHSNASLITVSINADEKCVSVAIHDDGQGFQTKPYNQKKSLGLQSAESRVLYLKGKFSLKTEHGKGTVIDMEIPLQFYESHVNGF